MNGGDVDEPGFRKGTVICENDLRVPTAFFHMAVGTIGMQVGADAVFQRLRGVCRIGQTGQICDRVWEFEFALGACLVFLCRIGTVK